MLRVNKLTDYATVILCHMARTPANQYSATALAAQLKIAPPTVSKILKMLTIEGLLSSKRGFTGGYQLAADPKNISVADVVGAMEGKLAMTECSLAHGLCHHEHLCALQANWQKLNRAVVNALGTVSLADMASDAPTPEFMFKRIIPAEQPIKNFSSVGEHHG